METRKIHITLIKWKILIKPYQRDFHKDIFLFSIQQLKIKEISIVWVVSTFVTKNNILK